jgi:hypothetical protein
MLIYKLILINKTTLCRTLRHDMIIGRSAKIPGLSSDKKIFPFASSPQLVKRGESFVDPKLRKLADSIENTVDETENDRSKNFVERFRLSTKEFMNNTIVGRLYSICLLVLSVVSTFEFIYSTYLHESTPGASMKIYILQQSELIMAVIFSFDWLLSLFLADHKLTFLSR